MLDGLSVKKGETKCVDEIWSGEIPRWVSKLRIFGEIGIVRRGGILKKLDSKGFAKGYTE